ncbi:MAG: glycosyltransferase family 87 protein [Verrucomicrobiia bacterium]
MNKVEFSLALLPALFFTVAGLLVVDWSRPGFWTSGSPMSGDLIQHYAAGVFLDQERHSDLYRGFHLGDWITDYTAQLHPESTYTIVRFNYVYSPLCAGIARAFTSIPFPLLTWAWLAGCFAAYLAAAACLAQAQVFAPRFRFIDLLWLIGFPSFFLTLIPMQNTVLTLAIAAASGWLLHLQRPFLAGLVFACAAYKPQLLPPVAAFLLLCGQWRFAVGVGLGGSAWLLLGILWLGWPLHALWLESLSNMADGVQFQREGLNQSWRGFFLSLPATQASADGLWLITSGLLTAATWWLACRWLRRGGPPADLLWIALTWWLAISPYVGHYELLLGIPWWFRMLRNRPSWPNRALVTLFWLTSALSISGLIGHQLNLSAPLLTTWLLGSLIGISPTSLKSANR